MASYSGPGQN